MAEGQSITVPPAVEYRDVPGFPGYRVGDDGSMWTAWEWVYTPGVRGAKRRIGSRWKRTQPSPNEKGYLAIALRKDGKRFPTSVHRVVLLTFVGPCPEGMEACHGNGNRADNRLPNLRWDTRVGNASDKVRHGTHPSGAGNGNSKLTEADVRAIRRERQEKGTSYRKLGRRYGLTPAAIRKVAIGIYWGAIGA